jgi:hypothetical protein
VIDLKTGLNSIGILLTIIGVCVVYWNSPLNEFVIDGGSFDTDFAKIEKTANRKNHLMTAGTLAIIIGSLLQLVSNFVPSKKSDTKEPTALSSPAGDLIENAKAPVGVPPSGGAGDRTG